MTFDGPPQSWYEPADEPIFTCPISGQSNEDCEQNHAFSCEHYFEEWMEQDEEPADFDDYRLEDRYGSEFDYRDGY